ncbi:hypothetical protein [Spirosoma validum]|uniref:Uncharacterized protein n=1 Tax=Spirosoma validum TaxID=2771355 RepID=A0A927AXL3_9BACT|nr:hypothetical protein [Spirosoma validum]MBD2751620.1 hypothetical protein [Spirosoma validum]
MALDQHASNLITLTVKAFDGSATSVSPMDGMSLIDSWTSFLKTDNQQNSSVISGLDELKAELQSGNLDGTSIQRILNNLVDQSSQLIKAVGTENKSELTPLTDALQSFSQQAGGSGKPANTGGQAPMTSTVGGESTNRGIGASAFDTTDDDDLSDRNGGTVDTDPEIDMDDTTGSDGRPEKDRLSGDPDETGDSSYSSQPSQSRSDTSRVSGIGISGGSGDTSTSQSGGRSQY